MLRGFADKRERRDVDGADAGGEDADVDFGNAGNDERRTDDDGELVGSGVAFSVDVGTADVSVEGWNEEECRDEEKAGQR
jgi:hypothetical protein